MAQQKRPPSDTPDEAPAEVEPPDSTSDDQTPESGAHPSDAQGLSLGQLSEAFAEMLRTDDGPHPSAAESSDPPTSRHVATDRADDDPGNLTPCGILEAMLFVGRPDNEPLNSAQIAPLMRGVSPSDIDELVVELNAQYDRDGSPYEVVSQGAGYQLALRKGFWRVRDKFYGRTRQAKLSQAAIEVLAIVAYNQPMTRENVNTIRGSASGHTLSQLVRRQLLRIERPADAPRVPQYSTTQRFLRLFGLEKLEDLPHYEDAENRL